MSDLERRLREALHTAAEPARRGLTEAVRRHRRHKVRAAAGLGVILAVVAVAVPAVAGALNGSSPTASGGARPSASRPRLAFSPAPPRSPVAAPGTVLVGCGDGPNAGAIDRPPAGWGHGQSLPLHFLPGGHSSGRLRLYVAIAVLTGLRPGTAVVVTVPRANRADLRFLYADSLTPGTRYTMRSGEAGVTFVACNPSQETVPTPGITDYYGGYLVRGARCVPVDVGTSGQRHLAVVRLGDCPRH